MIEKSAISFDMWQTLIRSVPTYNEKKYRWLTNYVNTLSKVTISQDIVEKTWKEIDKEIDYVIEKCGYQPHRFYFFAMFFARLNIDFFNLNQFDQDFQNYFLSEDSIELMPDVKDYFHLICEKYSFVQITSNVLCIKGSTLFNKFATLFDYNIREKYNWILKFSDTLNVAKPSNLWYGDNVWKSINIAWHIGDSIVCDGNCEKFKIKFYQITTNQKTLKDFYNENCKIC